MSGAITRKQIIEDEAIGWGGDYVKAIQPAIDKNKEFVASILALNDANNQLRGSRNDKELQDSQKKTNELGEKSIGIWKEQNQLELALISTKRKNTLATESTNQALIKERVEMQATNKAMKQAALEQLGMVSAYTKLNNARTEAKNKLRDLLAAEVQNKNEIKAAQREFDMLASKVKKADDAVNDFTKNVGNYPFQNAANGIKNLIGAFGITTGIALFAGIMSNAYETTKKFEQGVADLSAITGATGKDLDFLKNKAIDLGKGVEGGAIAVVEAYKLIASAKPELLDNVNALNQVTEAAVTLSQAAGIDLPSAATALTDALNQFNLPADQAGNFIDALANGAKFGAAEIPQITEALLKFGAVARSSNINIKESTALIELLAENGLKGADAGTALRNVLLKISAPDALPLKAREAIDRLGISMETLKDKTIPIQQKLELLKPILNDNAALVKVFGLENVVAAQNIIGHTDRLKELTSKMDQFGTAEEQANIRMDTLTGDTVKLKSTYDSLVLSIGEGSGAISGFFRFFVQGAKDSLEGLIRLNSSWDEIFAKAKDQGTAQGNKSFAERFNFLIGTGSTEEVSNSIKAAAKKQLEVYQQAFEENSKNIKEAEDSKYGLRNPFALSPKELKQQKEELKRNIAEQAAIIKAANEKINTTKTPVKTEDGVNTATTVGLSEKDKAAILAREKKFADDYLKLLKSRINDEFKLNQFRYEREIYYNELILNDDEKTSSERIDAYLQIQQVREASAKDAFENELQNNAIARIEEKKRELETLGGEERITKAKIEQLYSRSQEEIKATLQTGALRKGATADEILAYEKYLLAIKKLDDKAIQDKQKIIDSEVAQIQKGINSKTQSLDTSANDKLTKENEQFASNLELIKGNQELIEQATAEHQRRLLKITSDTNKEKLKIEIDTLQTLLDNNGKLPAAEQISADKRAEIENKISKFRKDLSEIDVENVVKADEKKVAAGERYLDLIKEQKDREKELATALTTTLVDLANTIFDAKVSVIDAEIQAVNDSYASQIEAAGNDQRQKDLLEKERDKKTKELEKQRKKELIKAAIFNKIISVAQIGLDLAKTITAINLAAAEMDALAAFLFGGAGATHRGIQIPLAIGLAAAQTAVVLATPLPKYKDGRKGGPEEWAITGDGGRHEVLSNADGSNPIITPDKPTLTHLKKNQRVHRSIDEYKKYLNASILENLRNDNMKLKEYTVINNNSGNTKDLLEELKRNTDAVRKGKANINLYNNIDFGHQVWKMSNTNWNRK